MNRRSEKPPVWLPIVATLACCLAINQYAIDHPLRLDLTSTSVYSLSAASIEVAAGVERPVEIVFFYDQRSRAMQDARYLLEQYAAHSPQITLSSHDPVLEPAAAERHGVRFAGSAIFRSEGRRIVSNEANEVALTNALIRVTSEARGRICFSDGHIESNPLSLQTHDHFEAGHGHGHDHASGGRALTLHERHGMGMARNALEVQGYVVEQRRLAQGVAPLEACALLVIASPQTRFAAHELEALESALADGMPVLFLLEPDRDTGLDEILGRRGVRLRPGRIRDPGRYYRADLTTPAVSDYARHRATRELGLSFFPGAAALEPAPGDGVRNDLVHVPLALTSAQARLDVDAEGEARARTLALLVSSRDSAERFAVVGDGDFATNSYFAAMSNGQLFLNLVNELTAQAQLIDIKPREYRVARLELDNIALRLTFLVSTFAAPVVLIAIGAWVIWRRR